MSARSICVDGFLFPLLIIFLLVSTVTLRFRTGVTHLAFAVIAPMGLRNVTSFLKFVFLYLLITNLLH